jgi:hypothetical protein
MRANGLPDDGLQFREQPMRDLAKVARPRELLGPGDDILKLFALIVGLQQVEYLEIMLRRWLEDLMCPRSHQRLLEIVSYVAEGVLGDALADEKGLQRKLNTVT